MKFTAALSILLTTSLLQAETPPPAQNAAVSVFKAQTPPPGQNLAVFPVPRMEPHNQQRHIRFNEQSKEGTAELVFLGDSITQGWEGAGKAAWDKYWAPNYKAVDFGIGGDRTEHILWRLDNGNFDGLKPKAIVLMIGTNNVGHLGRPQAELGGLVYHCSAEETAQGVKAILEKLKTKLPDTKVLLLGIFPRGADGNDPARKQNEATNAIIKGFADDKTVFFMDIGSKLLQPHGILTKEIMPDLLHLSPQGYEIWCEAIKDKVQELMN